MIFIVENNVHLHVSPGRGNQHTCYSPYVIYPVSVMNNIKGYVFGIVTSVTFGLIPLFTLPLMHKGMNYDSILFYRFL